MRNTNKTKELKMKFQADEKYDFIFTSKPFTIVSNDGREELVRWSYNNDYGSSAYDKSTCPYSGKKCNFNSIALEYRTECQGKLVWLSYEDYEPMVTKRNMMEMINAVNEKFSNGGYDFEGKYQPFSRMWKIKEGK
jgi:hypothetical protein